MPKIKKKKSGSSKDGNNYIFKTVLIGSTAGIVSFFALTTILTLLAFVQDFEDSYYPYLILFASSAGAFASGFTAVVPIKRNGLVIGILSVMPMFFFIIAVASIINRASVGLWGWISLGIMLIMGSLGGIVAANKRKKVKLK